MNNPYSVQQAHTDAFFDSFNASSIVNGRRALDLGCGDGYAAVCLKNLGASEVLAVDPEPREAMEDPVNCLDRDKRMPAKLSKAGIKFSRGLSLEVVGSGLDLVWNHHVIEHVPDPVDFLNTIHQILNVNGQLWLACPNMQDHNVFSPGHIHNFMVPNLLACAMMAGWSLQGCSWWVLRGQLRIRLIKHAEPSTEWPKPCADLLKTTGRINADRLPSRWNWD